MVNLIWWNKNWGFELISVSFNKHFSDHLPLLRALLAQASYLFGILNKGATAVNQEGSPGTQERHKRECLQICSISMIKCDVIGDLSQWLECPTQSDQIANVMDDESLDGLTWVSESHSVAHTHSSPSAVLPGRTGGKALGSFQIIFHPNQL